MYEKLEAFDEIYFKRVIMSELIKKDPSLANTNPYDIHDVEDEILDQLEAQLIRL